MEFGSRRKTPIANCNAKRESTLEPGSALRESEERFRQLAENSSDVFWIINGRTRQLEYLNPVYEKIFGESPAPIMRDAGRWAELIHPEDRDHGADMLDRLLAGKTVTVDYRIIRPNDGAIRWIRDRGFPIRDEHGQILRVAGVLQDITEEKERITATQESETRFRAIANLVPDLLWSLNPNGEVDWINQRWVAYTGQSPEDAAGEGWLDTIHPDDVQEVKRRLQTALAEGRMMRHEQRIRSANGEYRWFLVQKEPVLDDEGTAIKWFAAATDIHEQRTAADVVRESERRFRLLVEGAREYAIFMMDPSNTITHWNSGAERVFGWSAEEAVGQSGRLVFTPEDVAQKQEEHEIEVALREGSASDRRWHLRKDGSRIWVDGMMHRVDDEKTGALRGFAKVARDATAERLAQEELEERVRERTAELTASNERLQNEMEQRARLEQEILLISEREKRRIGQDLHDSLCQELAATAFILETQAQKVAKKNSSQAKTFSEAARTVNANVGLARDLARGLHPIELNTAGLQNALRELAFRTEHSGKVSCRLLCPRPVRIRDDAVALNLYRIAQEAVNNALKHAKPSEIVLTLVRKRSILCLEIRDNGAGLSRNRSGKGGMGVDIMQHRANVIGAKLTIESRQGRGTSVTCALARE